jgi:signal peptidase I
MRKPLRTAAGVLLLFCAAAGLVTILRAFVVDTASVHTSSMVGTLLPGDVVLINKLAYGPATPAEIPFTSIALPVIRLPAFARYRCGDVVLLVRPMAGEQRRRLIKRIVGLPGDTLEIRRGLVYRNGCELPLPSGASAGRQEDVPAFRIPRPGETLMLTPDVISVFGPAVAAEARSTGLDAPARPGGTYRVHEEWFYLLGDNRENSLDSRTWGCATSSEMVGKPVLVFWSRDEEDAGRFTGIRWGRIGTVIR